MAFISAIMPKEDRYFDMFNRHAATLVKGADALRQILNGGDDVEAIAARLRDHEHEADEIAREVLLTVRRTLITPFDRSDIRGLTNSLDDSIDQMLKTAKIIVLFEQRVFDPSMREIGDHIVEQSKLTVEAVSLLQKMGRNRNRLNELTEKITVIESLCDDIYDRGMKALVEKSRSSTDPMTYTIGSEIYDHLEKCVDRFEDVANRISGIMVEHL